MVVPGSFTVFRGALVMALACLAVFALGCGRQSPPITYYLIPFTGADSAQAEVVALTGPRLLVGPVTVPAYLESSRMIVRKRNRTDVQLAEYDQWSEPVVEGVTRVLCMTISQALAVRQGVALPQRAALPHDWRASVDIARLDGAPGEDVVLDAVYVIFAPNGRVARQGRFVERTAAGDSLQTLVAAHGQLVTRLGEQVATALLTALPTPASPRERRRAAQERL